MTLAALIDLDGTLLDTAPDIAAAANAMLGDLGLRRLPDSTISGFIGQGIGVLVARCLKAAAAPAATADEARALESFSGHYERFNGRLARIYPGVLAGLERMRADGLRLACVTNKVGRFTIPLLQASGLAGYFAATVSGDSVGKRKPHPEPFLAACRELGIAPRDAVAIGDSANDALAARAAGCGFLLVPYGYREGREVQDIPCDGIVASLVEAAERIAARL